METTTIIILLSTAAAVVLITAVISVAPSWSLWFQTLVAGHPVNPYRVALMRMRKMDPNMILEAKVKAAHSNVKVKTRKLEDHHLAGGDVKLIVDAKVKAAQAGIDISTDFLESHYLAGGDVNLVVDSKILAEKAGIPLDISLLGAHNLAGGNVKNVIKALISANKATIPLDFDRAAAIDLAGRDVLEAVEMSVRPKVIKTEKVTAVAKDGIEVTATARVTVRMDLDNLVGGAGEDTVLARVGEGIVGAIGSAPSHKEVLENPQSISKKIWSDELGKDTAFFILSVDVADVDLGRNVGAKHEVERAEADTKIAQAEAERKEQEMRVRILEMKAKLVEAESRVPLAMSAALKKGKLGVMDYYRMRNVRADSQMRESFSKTAKRGGEGETEEEKEGEES